MGERSQDKDPIEDPQHPITIQLLGDLVKFFTKFTKIGSK